MSKTSILISAFTAVMAVAFAAPSASQGQQAARVACPEAGEKLYQRSCLACHGLEAEGASITLGGRRIDTPSLRGMASAPEADWEEIIDFIEEGHGSMPAWGGVINRPNLRRILEYLDSLDRPELYAHDMAERARKRRRGQPTDCELEDGPEEEPTSPPPVQPGQES